jgi:CysZ protein
MILSSFFAALSQATDPRFRRVVLLGVGLALALLVAAYLAFLWLIQWAVPDTLTLPFIGPVGGIDAVVSWGSALLMILLSVFLMVPVASAFTGLFLEDVAQAVEDRHYPGLPPAQPVKLIDGMIASVNLFGLIVLANVLALVLYLFAGPLIPIIFWAVNGYLLGREYFTLVAMRRVAKPRARALWQTNRLRIWAAGVLMAAPLSVPLLNLFVPVFGVATFTHLFHRINQS